MALSASAPFIPTVPFTRRQARAAGITDHELRGPRYRCLLHGVYISSAVPDTPQVRAAAALLVHPPGAVATHFTAARIRRAPVPVHPWEHVTVGQPSDRRQRRGLRCHVATLAAADVRVVAGLRVSAPERMFVELAEYLSLVDLVVLGDWLVKNRFTTPEELVSYCRAGTDRHAKHAREAASFVRQRVDSPMETRLRMLLVLAGFPEPEVNRKVRDENGTVVLRLDLSYPGVKVAVEYDGRQHLELVDQWERDVERRDDLDGWRVVTVTSKGIHREPELTLRRVARALEERGFRPLPRLRDDWRPHFT
jgi:very-short-patch-repair endonuclease